VALVAFVLPTVKKPPDDVIQKSAEFAIVFWHMLKSGIIPGFQIFTKDSRTDDVIIIIMAALNMLISLLIVLNNYDEQIN
jgi:hypothetical protein